MSRKITVKCFCASDGICNRNAIKSPPSAIRQTAEGIYSVCRKSLFFQKVLVLNPYKNALWALHPAKPLGIHARRPCRGWMWGCRPHQARTRLLSVAHSRCTMQRHQRLTTRIGATPQTPFSKIYRFIDRLSCCRLSDAGFRKITLPLTAYLLL